MSSEQKRDDEQSSSVETASPSQERVIASLKLPQLFAFAVTSGKFGYLLAISYLLYGRISEAQKERFHNFLLSAFADTEGSSLLLVSLAILLLSWICSIVVEMVTYANFKIIHRHGEISVQYGLLKRRRYQVPTDRVRAVVVKESFLRQLVGLVSVYVEVNRGRGKGGQEVLLLHPVIAKTNLGEELSHLLPSAPAIANRFERAPLRSLHRYMLARLIRALVFLAIAYYIFLSGSPTNTIASFSVMWFLLFFYFGYVSWKYSGISFSENNVAIRTGGFSLNTTAILRRCVLGIEAHSHPLQRRAKVCSISVILPSGVGARSFAHCGNETAQKAYQWFGRRLPVQRGRVEQQVMTNSG